MSTGVADTNILIELYRKLPAATTRIETETDLAITSVTWLEFMEGARGKAGQVACQRIMAPFDLTFLTRADQQWAMRQILKYRLSHGVSFKDCLIASTCHRLQIPLYTRNVKDFRAILSASLIVKPY